jgi:hypothetical protein
MGDLLTIRSKFRSTGRRSLSSFYSRKGRNRWDFDFSRLAQPNQMTWTHLYKTHKSSLVRVECGGKVGTAWIAARSPEMGRFAIVTALHNIILFGDNAPIVELSFAHQDIQLSLDRESCRVFPDHVCDAAVVCVETDLSALGPSNLNALPFWTGLIATSFEELPAEKRDEWDALLKSHGVPRPELEMTVVDPRLEPGEEVGWLGYPSIARHIFGRPVLTFGHGYISGASIVDSTYKYVIDASVGKGMSGAPVWNREGKVIGMITHLYDPVLKSVGEPVGLGTHPSSNFGVLLLNTHIVNIIDDIIHAQEVPLRGDLDRERKEYTFHYV